MTDVVVVFSSPRPHGNSCTIAEAIASSTMGLSTRTVKAYRLSSMNSMRGCQNCMRCINGSRCYIEDDLTPLLNEIEGCSSLILAVPLFFDGVCSQFKTLEDRLFSHLGPELKPKYPGKKLVIVITHDDPKDDECVKMVERRLEETFVKKLGYEAVGSIVYPCHGSIDSAKNDEGILSKAREIGKLL